MTNTQTATTTPTATCPTSQAGGLLGALTPIALMILVFYFLIMRPQQKRESKRRELVNSVKKGDKVVTASGIIGVVHKVVSDKELSLEISEGIRMRVLKNSISEVLEKGAELGVEAEEKASTPKSKPASKPTKKKAKPSKK